MVLSTTDKIKGGLRKVISASKVSYMLEQPSMDCYSHISGTMPLISSNNVILRSISREIGMKEGPEGTSIDSAEKQSALRQYEVAREGLKKFVNQSAIGPLVRMSMMDSTTLVANAPGEIRDLHSALESHPDNAVFNAAFNLALALSKQAGLSDITLREMLE